MIVVLDTNVWISALFFGGKPEQALLKAFEEDTVAVCKQLIEEIEEVAVRKFLQQAGPVKKRLDELTANALWIKVLGELKVSRDPDDDVILECARNSKAQVIISGDNDLLDLKYFEGIPIMTAGQYLKA